MKVAVAGAGIAGSVLTRMLRQRGHEVTVYDRTPHRAASRCAFAYLRTGWFTGPEKARVREALAWYDMRGWHLTDQAEVHDLQRGRIFTQGDHHLIDPYGPLVKADGGWNVETYRDGPGGVLLTLTGGLETDAHHLVLACGPGMERFTFGGPSYGGIFESQGPWMRGNLRLLRVTDRLTHVAAGGRHITRVGASKAKSPDLARAGAEKILKRMTDEGVVDANAPWTYRAGVRWTDGTGPGRAIRLSDHVHAFTGFSRTGYAFVPSAARVLVDQMEGR